MSARADRVNLLFDLLASEPDGLTITDIMTGLDCARRQANTAIHDLRIVLGDSDTINITCDPQGEREKWNYRLVGDLDGNRRWIANRLGDTETRLRTLRAIARSLVSGTDGRTLDGRRARLINKALQRLIEDLDELLEAPR
jgi:anaerobic glycerol-3-phosphate dehydrogenase